MQNMSNETWFILSMIILVIIVIYQAFTYDNSSRCDEKDYECQYYQNRGEDLDNPARWGR
jgi:hypothetical protein